MATSQLSLQFFHPISATSQRPTGTFRPKTPSLAPKGIKFSQVEPSQSNVVDVKQLVNFLYDDLPRVFDDQGIDPTAYDKRLKFRDPITKIDSIRGYLFTIALLKLLFKPHFSLHSVKQTEPYEIRTRWTLVMKFMLLPWKPELVFTGTGIMGINPDSGKFCSHLDLWDSVENNDYFSFEGLWDVLKQYKMYETPDLETPKYEILKRTANYEVRKYAPFIGLDDVAGYIFGKNSASDKIPMTTPVFTQANDAQRSAVSVQIVLPSGKESSSLPDRNGEKIRVRKVEGGTAAVLKFSGKPTEVIISRNEKELRSNLVEDGLKPKMGFLFARHNYPATTWSFMMG